MHHRLALFAALVSASLPLRADEKPPIDPNEARPHVSWKDAHRVLGRVAYVSGKVESVVDLGRVKLLNFDDERPPTFAGVVFGDHADRFPSSLKELYEGRHVRIRGFVTKYREKPQIQLTGPDQIEVLEAPESPDFKPPGSREVGDVATVATFNILNLFDAVDDEYRWDDTTPPKPRENLDRVADVIRAMNADVLALQEVENRGYLERFVEVFLPDMGYEVVLFEGNDTRGIDVCLLSRIPVGRVVSHRHLRFPGPGGERRFERDVLAVELLPESGEPFEAWVVHLKSNSGGREYAEDVRIAEAKALRRLLDERLTDEPDARFVVMGDFNDTWDSTSLRTIVGTGSTALKAFHAVGSEQTRVTYNLPPYLSMIDYILCSPAMAKAYVEESFSILASSLRQSGSDHNPVLARFRLGKTK